MTRNMPEIFAILRDGIRFPCLQVLRSYPCDYNRNERRNNPPYRGFYEISNVENVDSFDGRLLPSPHSIARDRAIYILHTYHPETGERLEVYYWFTPFALESQDGMYIPLLEFQYRSWIPTGYTPVTIRANINDMYAILSQIQNERLAEIRRREDNDAFQVSPRQYSDPYFEPRRYNEDAQDTWWRMAERGVGNHRRSRPQTPPPPPQPRIVEVPVPVERVVVQVQEKTRPLPKDIGNLILTQARKGAEACPIATTPFSECEALCVTSCFHTFDAASLARWQESHTSCPVCRSKIENVVVEDRQNGVPAV
jgi:hypothetical protein